VVVELEDVVEALPGGLIGMVATLVGSILVG